MPFDVKAAYRDGQAAGNLTASGTSAALQHDYLKQPVRVVVIVPSVSGTNPTLQVDFQHSDDGTTFSTKRTLASGINAPGVYVFNEVADRRYSRLAFTVGGTTPNFGQVSAYLVPA
jgi:hypothetical protein